MNTFFLFSVFPGGGAWVRIGAAAAAAAAAAVAGAAAAGRARIGIVVEVLQTVA